MNQEHPDREGGDDSPAEVGPRSVPDSSRWLAPAGIAIAVLVIIAFVLLHLSGAVGPSAH